MKSLLLIEFCYNVFDKPVPSGIANLSVSWKSKSSLEAMTEILKNMWDNERIEYALPPFMALRLRKKYLMIEVQGSITGAVQSWRKTDPQNSQKIWKKLAEANAAVERQLLLLKHLAQEQEEIYINVLESCSKHLAEKVNIKVSCYSYRSSSYTSAFIHHYTDLSTASKEGDHFSSVNFFCC
eukprot:Gb_31213 [translate_table: standard]